VTGPEQPAPPPGWYPDPDGAAGMVRWWSGTGWSDVATPAGPGVAVRSSPVLAPPARPPASAEPTTEILSSEDRGRTGWIVGVSLLVLVLVVGIGVVVGRSSGGAAPVAAPSPSAPAPPAGPSFPQGTVRIIDHSAGISYPYLGDGWYEYALFPQEEVTSIAGQFFTTQEVTPDNSVFIAQCTSGPLAEGYGWGGAPTLAATTAAVADSVRDNYYPGPNERRVLRDEARTVDGRAAHLYEFQLSWDVAGYDATGERAALLLIDVGRPAPALLYVSIPNTHAELYSVIDRLLQSVDVLE
jgi:Protein of unknown function (DUF2510)